MDPGLNVSGYGVVEVRGDRLLVADAGVIRTGSDRSLQARLAEIHEGISEVFANWSPTEMAVEELYAHYERPRTAILMGHARGVLCLAAAQNQVPLLHYSATRIKSLLTGNGRAPKTQVQLAVQNHLGLNVLPEPPDLADALAVAICHYFHSRIAANFQ